MKLMPYVLLPPVITQSASLVELFCSMLQYYDYLKFGQGVLLGSITCCYFGATPTLLFDMQQLHGIS
jgi:hypothetical protein